jgi:hypothetical protein
VANLHIGPMLQSGVKRTDDDGGGGDNDDYDDDELQF